MSLSSLLLGEWTTFPKICGDLLSLRDIWCLSLCSHQAQWIHHQVFIQAFKRRLETRLATVPRPPGFDLNRLPGRYAYTGGFLLAVLFDEGENWGAQDVDIILEYVECPIKAGPEDDRLTPAQIEWVRELLGVNDLRLLNEQDPGFGDCWSLQSTNNCLVTDDLKWFVQVSRHVDYGCYAIRLRDESRFKQFDLLLTDSTVETFVEGFDIQACAIFYDGRNEELVLPKPVDQLLLERKTRVKMSVDHIARTCNRMDKYQGRGFIF